jgi:hypothetical protein
MRADRGQHWMRDPRLSLCLLVAAMAHVLALPPNATDGLVQHHREPPIVNISFIKEVTLSVQPQDFEFSPQDQQQVTSFLDSSLRLLDPIMRFLDSLMGGRPIPEHVDPRFAIA